MCLLCKRRAAPHCSAGRAAGGTERAWPLVPAGGRAEGPAADARALTARSHLCRLGCGAAPVAVRQTASTVPVPDALCCAGFALPEGLATLLATLPVALGARSLHRCPALRMPCCHLCVPPLCRRPGWPALSALPGRAALVYAAKTVLDRGWLKLRWTAPLVVLASVALLAVCSAASGRRARRRLLLG